MDFSRRIFLLIPLFAFCVVMAYGQNRPIGSWESYLPYNSCIGVATNGNQLFAIGRQSFSTHTPSAHQLPEAFSKTDGMSDIGMQAVGYDFASDAVILVYTNGNIDIFKDNTFYNVPDLKIKTIAGAKTVYEVYTLNGYAYLSTALGVIVINMSDHTVKETYQFNLNSQVIPVKSFTAAGNYFFAATTNGLYRVAQSNPQLQNFQVWDIVDSTQTYTSIKNIGEDLFLTSANSIYKISGTNPAVLFYSTPFSLKHIDAGYTRLLVSEYIDTTYTGIVKLIDPVSSNIDSFLFVGYPVQAVQALDSSVWVADQVGGLLQRTGPNSVEYHAPAGPLDANAYDIYAYNNNLWLAHGGYTTDKYDKLNNQNGIANYNSGKWAFYKNYNYPPFNGLTDFVVITKDETDGTIYTGSYGDGLMILKPDGTAQQIKDNSIFDPSSYFSFGSGRLVSGLALDKERNLWISTSGSAHQLYVKTVDSAWYSFAVPGAANGGQVLVDDNDQVWFISITNDGIGGGITVYNYNGTPADKTDDVSYHLSTGVGFGNLPSNKVLCFAKDKSNNIWVGTSDGIGIVNSCHPSTGQAAPCDAEIPIVQYDKYAGYLFKGNSVRTIAVDGANRKWVGTDDGVWLLSSDAGKIIYNFTVDNSPLPSNHIQKIGIDPVTGMVYIGTDQGLVSFRGTATDGGTSNSNVLTFPNPVPSGYTGTIAIKGLVANGDVRITDISGQLVYRTKALGGQAVWNGLDYTGHRPQSGVYLVFVSSSDGNQTYSGKMVFLN